MASFVCRNSVLFAVGRGGSLSFHRREKLLWKESQEEDGAEAQAESRIRRKGSFLRGGACLTQGMGKWGSPSLVTASDKNSRFDFWNLIASILYEKYISNG